jgi:hypothetical protein
MLLCAKMGEKQAEIALLKNIAAKHEGRNALEAPPHVNAAPPPAQLTIQGASAVDKVLANTPRCLELAVMSFLNSRITPL